LMSEAATRKAADEPWGYLARCDIARRMGSAELLATCLSELKQIVPHHPATLAALATQAERVSFGRWVARGRFLLLVLGTPAHALARRWRRRQSRTPIVEARAAAVVVLFCSLLVGRGVLAAQSEAGPLSPDKHEKVDTKSKEADTKPKHIE